MGAQRPGLFVGVSPRRPESRCVERNIIGHGPLPRVSISQLSGPSLPSVCRGR